MKFPKSKPYRNKRLLISVSMLECQVCGHPPSSDPAHSNWSHHGKSMSRKADDIFVAAMCRSCHTELDTGSRLTKEERQAMWMDAWKKTVKRLVNDGDWPHDIDVPVEALEE